MFEWFKNLLRKYVIQDVPMELAMCEFGCRVKECRRGEWQTCENRILDMEREAAYAQKVLDSNFNPGGGGLERKPN